MALDFFDPVVEEGLMHQNFRHILRLKDDTARNEFNRWANGFVDRDGKIVREFQTTFNSTFWEIYLHRLFSDLGLRPDYKFKSPDFLLDYNGNIVCVEAVVSSHADDSIPEWSLEHKMVRTKPDLTELNFSAMLRYLNSIYKKYNKYKNSYSQFGHVKNRPFVIALGSYDQPNFWIEGDRAIRAVLYDYYVDEQGDVDAPIVDTNGVYAKSIGRIKNKNGAYIDLGLFCNDSMKYVSAIVFSCVATHGKLRAFSVPENAYVEFFGVKLDNGGAPVEFRKINHDYSESIQDGLYVFHNPYAKNPLPLGAFRHQGVIQHYFSDSYGHMVIEGMDGFLYMRMSHVFFQGQVLRY